VITPTSAQFVPPDDFTDLTVAYDDNPDFNYKSFKLNAVFRWEYMPGSDLYIVWTQAATHMMVSKFQVQSGFRRRFRYRIGQCISGQNKLLVEPVTF
jgi:hypothetical protein